MQQVYDEVNREFPIMLPDTQKLRMHYIIQRFPNLYYKYPLVAVVMAGGSYSEEAFNLMLAKIESATTDDELNEAHGSYMRLCYMKTTPHFDTNVAAYQGSLGTSIYVEIRKEMAVVKEPTKKCLDETISDIMQ